MQLIKILNIAVAAIVCLSWQGCKREQNELAHNHNHAEGETCSLDKPAEGEHGEHEDEIVIEPERAEKLGIKTDTVSPGLFGASLNVGGRLLPATDENATVAAPASGVVRLAKGITPGAKIQKGSAMASVSAQGMAGGDANEAATAAYNAAKREVERMKPLHAEGIVSTRDYNAALQAMEAAKAALGASASGGVARATISGAIGELFVAEGQYVEMGQPIATISASNNIYLVANVPVADRSFISEIRGAEFQPVSASEVFSTEEFQGKLVAAPQLSTDGYIPVTFSLRNNGTLTTGEYCEVFLQGKAQGEALAVPKTALTEQQGEYFVYVKEHADAYSKVPVSIGRKSGKLVEITHGLHPGDVIVVEGTTFVRLAEMSGAVPEGHSHSH